MIDIPIDSEFIKLDQFLKLAEITSTGGHSKILIQEGLVKVNGEIELRRGRKLKPGDVVEVEDEKLRVL
ncbi:S4 domain-containing protein YaaA [Clostridioides mangenotii]|uniref:S4 domain-containing protein YaaA n=1 Tax=Metaclostridioides mangenotii TaxID=1540 RepID=UPI001C0F4CBB|nr:MULTISPECIES: S4 domain-containing protein YaaA [Clostridioides]MBS5788701.1 S4 domain-containing protein YaaA [Clostridioides difficile]MBU5308693.1 S4 domain-containing protein YaaA [Clostridioides mangenotii]MCR1955043.1 S4 domain-containing protein YaaA [Clostridioides mangenotii]